MHRTNDHEILQKLQEEQLLKLVTHSFYNELIKRGIKNGGIVRVSTHLLDYVTGGNNAEQDAHSFYSTQFSIRDIRDQWKSDCRLSTSRISIAPLAGDNLPQIHKWLMSPEIRSSLITPLPDNVADLEHYFFGHPQRQYFGIRYRQRDFVGIIGAENIDEHSRKLEMKKFVGHKGRRGKGIGKHATLLFLYFVYCILDFNKVYIHSINTNIRNLNLNTKFGFELEGISLEDILVGDTYRDVVKMGLLRKRFLEIFAADCT